MQKSTPRVALLAYRALALLLNAVAALIVHGHLHGRRPASLLLDERCVSDARRRVHEPFGSTRGAFLGDAPGQRPAQGSLEIRSPGGELL